MSVRAHASSCRMQGCRPFDHCCKFLLLLGLPLLSSCCWSSECHIVPVPHPPASRIFCTRSFVMSDSRCLMASSSLGSVTRTCKQKDQQPNSIRSRRMFCDVHKAVQPEHLTGWMQARRVLQSHNACQLLQTRSRTGCAQGTHVMRWLRDYLWLNSSHLVDGC